MENEPEKQHKKQQYDWLKGYQFKKGQSGNPGGLKPGTKSMKRWAREYLESLPEEERLAFIGTLETDLVWRMAEGNPETKVDATITPKTNFTEEELLIAEKAIANRLKTTSDRTIEPSIGEVIN